MLENIMKHAGELRRALRNFKYELTENGSILLPAQHLLIGGHFTHGVNWGDWQDDSNLVVNEGLNDVLGVYLHGDAATATWYVAPFAGNVTPVGTWTAANFTANSTEFINYDEAARQAFVETAPSSQSLNNLASKATFTISTGGGSVYGAALISASAKSATTGKLFAATRFSNAPRVLAEDDLLNIGYTVSAAST